MTGGYVFWEWLTTNVAIGDEHALSILSNLGTKAIHHPQILQHFKRLGPSHLSGSARRLWIRIHMEYFDGLSHAAVEECMQLDTFNTTLTLIRYPRHFYIEYIPASRYLTRSLGIDNLERLFQHLTTTPLVDIWKASTLCYPFIQRELGKLLLPRIKDETMNHLSDPAYTQILLGCCVLTQTPCPLQLELMPWRHRKCLANLVAYLSHFKVNDPVLLHDIAQTLYRTQKSSITQRQDFATFASWKGLSKAMVELANCRNLSSSSYAMHVFSKLPRVDASWLQLLRPIAFCLLAGAMARRILLTTPGAVRRLRQCLFSDNKDLSRQAMMVVVKHKPPGIFDQVSSVLMSERIGQAYYGSISHIIPVLYTLRPELANKIHLNLPYWSLRGIAGNQLQWVPEQVWDMMLVVFTKRWMLPHMTCKMDGTLVVCTQDNLDGTYTIDGTRNVHLYDLTLIHHTLVLDRSEKIHVLAAWIQALSNNLLPSGCLSTLPFLMRHCRLLGDMRRHVQEFFEAFVFHHPDKYKEVFLSIQADIGTNAHALAMVVKSVPNPSSKMDDYDSVLFSHALVLQCRDAVIALISRQTRASEWLARIFIEGPSFDVVVELDDCLLPARPMLRAMAKYMSRAPLPHDKIVNWVRYIMWACKIKGMWATGLEVTIPQSEATFFEELYDRVPLDDKVTQANFLCIFHHNIHLLTTKSCHRMLDLLSDNVLSMLVEAIVTKTLKQPLPRSFSVLWNKTHPVLGKRTRSLDNNLLLQLKPDMFRELLELMDFAPLTLV